MEKAYKSILAIILGAIGILSADGQTDTIVTRLQEVAVVGIKRTSQPELSAATMISPAEVERLNILTMRDASALVPNLYMPQYGSRMTSSIYVRGLGARMDQPVVGLAVDNVPYLNKDAYDFDLFDIERIEVLRGAQSILNGRNTMAGQVNITTLSPWRYQGWKLLAEYGRANSMKASVGYYTKLSSTAATSLTAYYTQTDGYYRNSYNSGKLDKERQGTVRYKLSWHPTTRLSVTNVASGQILRQGGYPYASVATGQIAYNDTCYYRRNSLTDGLTIGWTGKRVVVTSVTTYQYIDDNMTLDQDFLPQSFFIMSQKRKEHAFTEDLYAKGRRGALSWLSGVFAFSKYTDMSAPVTFKDDGIKNLIEKHPNDMNPAYPIRWDQRTFLLGSEFLVNTRGAAAYGQASYRHGAWLLQGGVRIDYERATLDYQSHCNTSYTTYQALTDGTLKPYRQNPVDIDERGHLKQDFVQVLPKIAVGYDLNADISIYANAAKGYKSGGFNTQMFSDVLQQKLMEKLGLTMKYDVDEIVSYKPEKSWNYEIGLKSRFLDNRLSVDGTLFYIDCTDQQLTAFPDGLTTGRIMTNAGRTRSYGAEVSSTYSPSASVTLRASYGYTNARFVEYDNGKADLSGKRLPYAPAHTAFLSCAYELPVTLCGAHLSAECNVRGVGDIYWDDDNTVRQPFYALCGANIGIEKDKWSLSLWGENLTGTRYDTFYFVSMSNAFVQRGRPVTYGATLRVNL